MTAVTAAVACAPLAPEAPQSQPPPVLWHYGSFADMAYLYDFNHPANHLFRTGRRPLT